MSDEQQPVSDADPVSVEPEVEASKDFSASFRGYNTAEVDRFVSAAERRISTLEAEAEYLGRALEATDERVRDAEAGRREAAETVRRLRTELEELNASLPDIDGLRVQMEELRGQYDERIRAAEVVLAWVAATAGDPDLLLPDAGADGLVEFQGSSRSANPAEVEDGPQEQQEELRDDISWEPGPGWTQPPVDTEAGISPPPESRGAWSPPDESGDPEVG